MFFGSRWKMKSVVAAEAAAIAAWRVLSQGDRAGAIVFGDDGLEVVPPHRSADRVTQILNSVVRKNHALKAGGRLEDGTAMLNRALKKVRALARHDCLVCLIGDAAGVDEESRRHITRLTEHNDVLGLFVYDPLEQAMPDAGKLVFSDGGRQIEFNSAERRLREAWSTDFAQRLERMKETSRRHSIPVIPVHTAAPVLDQVREALGHAGGRG